MGARPAPAAEPRRAGAAGPRRDAWPVLVGLPLLTVCGLIAAWRDLIPGISYWDNAVGALVASVRFTGPLAAALAALVAAYTPAGRLRAGLLRAGGTATASYVALTLGVGVKTLWHNTAGHFVLSGVAAGLAALLLHVGIGYVAGSLVRSPLTAPAVAGAAYLATGWVLARDGAWWRLLAPTAAPPATVYAHWRPAVFHGQLAWCAGLGLLSVLVYALAVRRERWLVLPLMAALALAASGGVLLHRYHGRALAVSAATDLVCRDWPLTICVHPALRGALPDLETAAMPVAERLADTPGAFSRLVQLPNGAGTVEAGPGVRRLTLPALGRGFAATAMTSVVDQIPDRTACTARGAETRATALVLHWLATGKINRSTTEATRFARMSEPARRAWLTAHYEQLRTCHLRTEDFTRQPAAAHPGHGKG